MGRSNARPASRLADIIGEQVKALRSKTGGFFDALPPDQQDALLEVKRRFQAGEYGPGATAVARMLYEHCQADGISTCRIEGLIKWLRRPMER